LVVLALEGTLRLEAVAVAQDKLVVLVPADKVALVVMEHLLLFLVPL
jgi:hypothetical protein